MKIVIIGAGNLGTNLAVAMRSKGIEIIQIVAKTLSSAEILAEKVGAQPCNDMAQIDKNADFYVIAVNDDQVENVAKQLDFTDALVVHTSGSTSINVLTKYCKNASVLYPLQTFSKTRTIDFSNIPVCIEANTPENLKTLQLLAQKLSSNIIELNSEQRVFLHIAAVFACNFTNHMIAIAEDILQKHNMSFDMIKPLISETFDKIEKNSPKAMQTGPAVRGDEITINKHLALLKGDEEKIYSLLSKHIGKMK